MAPVERGKAMLKKTLVISMLSGVIACSYTSYAAPIEVTSWWISLGLYDGAEWELSPGGQSRPGLGG